MSVMKALFSVKTPSYGSMACCYYVSQRLGEHIKVDFTAQDTTLSLLGTDIKSEVHILRALNSVFPHSQKPILAAQVHEWIDYSVDQFATMDFSHLSLTFALLNNHLHLRSFFVGYHLSPADFAIFGVLKANPLFVKLVKTGSLDLPHLLRWFSSISELPSTLQSLKDLNDAKDAKKDRSDKGNMDIPLPGAIKGKVVTRFPPEPSGYLHIGHAKAALLNDYFAKSYDGKLIIRFDDTNPSKEKMEFEDSIKEDLKLLGITGDVVTHTSDHFDKIYKLALELIKKGLAYCDNTDVDTMRQERFDGINSKNRDMSVKDTLAIFDEMVKGTEKGFTYCLRAKVDMQDKNKCMRDPVIYRCNATPHHIHGSNWKCYPTYDFACPIVDSLEGVTHALRTIEYRDRNAQYEWFLKALSLRHVHVWDFSRLNFVHTLLSKRKLAWFVDEGHVTGWDDPRFATVRGIRRRGMTIEALRSYILAQGASQRELLLEWDKIWANNKKVLDPIAPRHTGIVSENAVEVVVGEGTDAWGTRDILKHKKNPDLGHKKTNYGPKMIIEQEDAAGFEVGEEVTFMDWGNVIVTAIDRSATGVVTKVTVKLNLDGDFKKTKKKLTWLAPGSKDTELTKLVLLDYDYLITKKKLEEDDSFDQFVTPKTEFITHALGDAGLRSLSKGVAVQLERKGYYIIDQAWDKTKNEVRLIFIPDGKVDSIACKHVAALEAAKSSPVVSQPAKKVKKEEVIDGVKEVNMYASENIYAAKVDFPNHGGKMYHVPSIYPADIAPATTTTAAPKPKKEKKEKKPKAAAAVVEAPLVTKLEIVVGKIVEVVKHPDADSLYIEKIDVGEAEPRQVVSGLVKFMSEADMLNRHVLVLKNMKPVAMRGVKSYSMVLCASDAEHTTVQFLVPPPGSVPGDRVSFEGCIGEPEPELKPKKKVFETVAGGFSVGDDLVVTWDGKKAYTDKGVIKTGGLVGCLIK